jgi:hypothetical protein
MQEQAPLPELFDVHVMSFAGEADATANALRRLFAIDETLARKLVDDTPVLVKRAASAELASALCDALGKVGAQVVLLPSAASEAASEGRPSRELPIGSAENDAAPAWGELALSEPATQEIIIPDEFLASAPDASSVPEARRGSLAMASSAADFVGADADEGGVSLPEIEPLLAPAVREAREARESLQPQIPIMQSGPPPPPPPARSRMPPPPPTAPLGLDSRKLPSLPSLGPSAPAPRASRAPLPLPSQRPQAAASRPPSRPTSQPGSRLASQPSDRLHQSGTRHLDFGDSQELPSIELSTDVDRGSRAGARASHVAGRGSLPDVSMNAELPNVAGRGSLPDVGGRTNASKAAGRASLPDLGAPERLPEVSPRASLPDAERGSDRNEGSIERAAERHSLAPPSVRQSLAPEGGLSFSGRSLAYALLMLGASLAIFGTGVALDNSIFYGNASTVSLLLHAVAVYLPGAIVLSLVQSS